MLRASVAFSSLMSDGVIDIAARITGLIAWNVSSDLRRVTTGHMRQVLPVNSPEKLIDDKAREILINVSRYYFDLGRYSRLIGPNFAEYIDEFNGLEVLFESFDRGKGVIIVSGHLGNPEIVGQAIGQFGLCAGVVSEELRNPLVERYMQKIRSTTGVRFFPTNLTVCSELDVIYVRADCLHFWAIGIFRGIQAIHYFLVLKHRFPMES